MLEIAKRARKTGVVVRLDGGAGMAHAGTLQATGTDAASFLHSQTSNDVRGLEVGEGNANARVTRTGHLEALFTVHRLADDPDPRFLMVLAADQVDVLANSLDLFLFADQVVLTNTTDQLAWWGVQGPKAAAIATAAFGTLGFEPWSSLENGAVRQLKRLGSHGAAQPGIIALRRSLTGDEGFMVGVPTDHPQAKIVATALQQAASEADALFTDGLGFSDALDALRIEAGVPRVGPETAGKKRLLPETGVEQHAVSYTKGCYLGQEVIARVRTYGSVPSLLRALVLDAECAGEPGDPIRLEDGSKVGAWASATWSVTLGKPIALAYLNRSHRAPGQQLALPGGRTGTVALLPVYATPDAAARVAFYYDRGVRTFATGDEEGALGLIEQAIRLDPTFSDGYEAIGVILGRAGKYHEAIDFFKRLEEVAPEEPMVNTNLSLYYMKLGDKITAEEEAAKGTTKQFARLARSKGRDWNATEYAQEQAVTERKDAERKRRMFSQVLEFDPDDPIALYGLGNACFRLEDDERAAEVLAKAIEVDKNNSAVWLLHGKVLERLDRVTDAVQVYKSGVDVASRKGDLMPLKEMEHRLLLLGAR